MPNSWPASRISCHRRGAFRGGNVDLVAVFAGVARARDARRRAGDRAIDEPVVANGGEIRCGELLQSRARVRTLNGDLRVIVARQAHRGVEAIVRADVLVIFFLVGRVHAQEIMIVGDLVDQHVVDESAVFVEQAGVLDLARLKPRGGVGGDGIGQFAAPPDR